QLVKPHEGASLNINNKAKLQYNTSMSPDTSRLGFRAEAFIGISRMASIMDTNANGILTRKIHCQRAYSKITPAIVGPNAGPIQASPYRIRTPNPCFYV